MTDDDTPRPPTNDDGNLLTGYPFGTMPTPEQRQAFGRFIADKPQIIQRILRAYPPWCCYRSTENPRFHYVIISVNESGKVTLGHGADSTLPGVATFGQSPEQLIVCNCGQWKIPTVEQATATRERMDAMHEAKHGKCNCDDPGHYHNIPQNPVERVVQDVLNASHRDARRALTRSRGPRGKA